MLVILLIVEFSYFDTQDSVKVVVPNLPRENYQHVRLHMSTLIIK